MHPAFKFLICCIISSQNPRKIKHLFISLFCTIVSLSPDIIVDIDNIMLR